MSSYGEYSREIKKQADTIQLLEWKVNELETMLFTEKSKSKMLKEQLKGPIQNPYPQTKS